MVDVKQYAAGPRRVCNTVGHMRSDQLGGELFQDYKHSPTSPHSGLRSQMSSRSSTNKALHRLPSYAVVSPAEAKRYAEVTRQGHYHLSTAEKFWRDRQPFLQVFGYNLRPRYLPDWHPSWLGTNLDPMFCEDSIMLNYYHVIDAIRSQDGSRVSIKRIPNNTHEVQLARFLTSAEKLELPNNHCVPILDVLADPFDKSLSLMVMPYLRPFNDPEFTAIGEVVDFIGQTLEGLHFLHSQRVAHRDCAAANIMMDARALYPHGHHPIRRNYSTDAIFEVTPLYRIDHPVKYYFIDFELSVHFPEDVTPYVVGRTGRDKEAPELSQDVPYDAFKVDIFALGNLYDKEFLQPLIDAMKDVQPARRLNAVAALTNFEEIRSCLNSSLLRWRLRSRSESAPERVMYDTVAVAREGIYHLKRLIA
ncbi:hypothetical protein AcV5_002161 [Taiwanofungus camphoratus]|nr:hypothetical protein AcV5_002161 [Antrodia cinnamomea]